MNATHPTDRELADFLLGKVDDSGHCALEEHLAECKECRDRAASVPPGDDTFIDLLTAARTWADAERSAAPTPTLADATTPAPYEATQPWAGSARRQLSDGDIPAALAGHAKYRIVRQLGTGGMGTVWLAEHAVMNRQVAVKVIRPDLLAEPGASERFLREVRAAAKLHHPHIVTAFDAESVGDSCLLVMEYIAGETLADRVKSGPLLIAEACRAARDAARGLAHAHATGLVHRDVKPHNLIRAADGSVKVLDFGLANVIAGDVIATAGQGLTGTGTIAGTPDYIAPEQVTDPHAADARADVYGLGCTLYHLLAGRPPFPGGSIREKLESQQQRAAAPIAGLPAGLAGILAKMLAKRPEDRYQTASEVAEALEAFSRESRPRKACRRSWITFAAGWLVIAAAAVVFKIQRDNQVITVKTDDAQIEVVMKRNGEVLRVVDKQSGQTWDIDTATNQIGLADQPDGLKLDLPKNEAIVLRRKDKEVFTVTRTVMPAAPTGSSSDSSDAQTESNFRLLDYNSDGLLSTDEMTERLQSERDKWDTNKDGFISLDEYKAYLAAYMRERKDAFAKELQGTWRSLGLTAFHTDLSIAGNHFVLKWVPKGPKPRADEIKTVVDGVMRLDSAVEPKRLRVVDRKTDKTLLLGIYRLQGESLALCFRLNPKDGNYPQRFETNPKAGTELLIMRSGKSDSSTAAVPTKSDRELILGTWRGVAGEIGGQPVPQEFIDMVKPTLTITADKFTENVTGAISKSILEFVAEKGMLPKDLISVVERGIEGIYHIDSTKSPKTIDISSLGQIRKTMLGIYSLEGDTLKLCLTIDPDKVAERPKEFATKKGEMKAILILKRQPTPSP